MKNYYQKRDLNGQVKPSSNYGYNIQGPPQSQLYVQSKGNNSRGSMSGNVASGGLISGMSYAQGQLNHQGSFTKNSTNQMAPKPFEVGHIGPCRLTGGQSAGKPPGQVQQQQQSKSQARPSLKNNDLGQRRQLQISSTGLAGIPSASSTTSTSGAVNTAVGGPKPQPNTTGKNIQHFSSNMPRNATTNSNPLNSSKWPPINGQQSYQSSQAGIVNGSSTSNHSFQNQPQNSSSATNPNMTGNISSNNSTNTTAASLNLQNKKSEMIVIHVFDENRKVNKDFSCDKDLLVSHMKYFEKYLSEVTSIEDIDISVHCDIKIFEWLMNYLRHKNGNGNENLNTQTSFATTGSTKGQTESSTNQLEPKLDLRNAISILISSDFLEMQVLVQECIDFVVENLHNIVRLPIDMNCLNAGLIKKIAANVTIEKLDSVVDKRDKLQSKLFMKKLSELLTSAQNASNEDNPTLLDKALNRCIYCNQLFTIEQGRWMVCPNAKIFIDFHGNIIAQHMPDRQFDINGFIQYMNGQKQIKWREIYWKIWSRMQSFDCSVCESRFVGSDLNNCRYHPQDPKFLYGSNKGIYPCCNQQALRFSTVIEKKGCCAMRHNVRQPVVQNDPAYDTLLKHETFATEADPSQPSNENVEAGSNNQVSLMTLLDAYIADQKANKKNKSKKRPNKFRSSTTNGVNGNTMTDDNDSPSEEEEDYGDENDESEYEYIEDQLLATQNQQAHISKRIKKALINGECVEKVQKKQRAWRQDMLRTDDQQKMRDLQKKMKKMRKLEAPLHSVKKGASAGTAGGTSRSGGQQVANSSFSKREKKAFITSAAVQASHK